MTPRIVTHATAAQLLAAATAAGHGPLMVGGDCLREALTERDAEVARLNALVLAGIESERHLLTGKDALKARIQQLEAALGGELRAIAVFIRTPGNINPEDAVDECARVLENRARSLTPPPALKKAGTSD